MEVSLTSQGGCRVSFSDIELEYAMGNHDKARRLLRRYLRQNPDSIEAWEMAVELAEDEGFKQHAEAGLRKAKERENEGGAWGDDEWDSTPSPSMASASGSGGSFEMSTGSAATTSGVTDYRSYAIGVIVATLFFPFFGPILAGVFMMMANKAEASGEPIANKGCLQQALIGSLVVAGFSLVVTCLAFIAPLLAEF
jgi:tetratricopeptide (TPR) repeat protein